MILFLVVGLLTQGSGPRSAAGEFLHEPYVQLGNRIDFKTGVTILWTAPIPSGADDAIWTVRFATPQGQQTVSVNRRVLSNVIQPYHQYVAELNGTGEVSQVPYEVFKNDARVFFATAKLPQPEQSRFRLVSFGDCGVGSVEQGLVIKHAALKQPDMVLITGDTVYQSGLASEYDSKFWPYYNSSVKGAPIMRTTPFMIATGNHDIGGSNLTTTKDGLAYFYIYRFPLNGPVFPSSSPFAPNARGTGLPDFLAAAEDRYPRMGNYSYDAGNVHFTVIDSNPNVNWNDVGLRTWLTQDLRSVPAGRWKVVAYHHPAFHSSVIHASTKHMRVLADLFVDERVDLVMNGHVHNYQRTHPLLKSNKPLISAQLNKDDWPTDDDFDGKSVVDTAGVMHVVTGGGGAGLYDVNILKLIPFSARYAGKHSYSVLDFNKSMLTFQQFDTAGRLIDGFKLRRKN